METVFQQPGHWYRGNLHMHSTQSDGRLAPEAAIGWYRERGYDFCSLTDHRITTDASAFAGDDFLVIPGAELNCRDEARDGIGYHIVGLGIEPFAQDPELLKGPGQGLVDAIRAHGGEAIMAHPYWLGQESGDIMAVEGALGLEVFNATCARPGKEYSMVHWDNLLDRGVSIWGLATDDAHHYARDAGRGWVMVRAPELSQAAIMSALGQGHFYATQGPAILDLHREGDSFHVLTSPVQEIRFISNRGRGEVVAAGPGERLTSASSSRYRRYLRVEVVDEAGLRAWSQPVFLEE